MNIEIVDHGRGAQLSTSRITVQDLYPYLQGNVPPARILEVMPSLTVEEIEAVARYIAENREAVEAQDRRIRDRAAARRQSP